MKENGIRYRLDKMHYWMNYGNTKKRNKTKKELMKQYASCNHVCKSLVNGQIHLCPRSSHGTDLGIIKNNKDDYLDLLDETMSIREKKKRINGNINLLNQLKSVSMDVTDVKSFKGNSLNESFAGSSFLNQWNELVRRMMV